MTGSAALKAGVVGDPISHSQSPTIHRAAYAALGIEGASYEAIRVPEGELASQWRRGAFEGFAGLSVTMPHKHAAAAFATRLSPRVELLGAANTLVVEDGGVFAENTDVDGIVEALRAGRDAMASPARAGLPRPETGDALVVGGGGTALAALAALAELGTSSVTLALRSPAKADDGAPSLRAAAEALGLRVDVVPLAGAAAVLAGGTGVAISTLPPRAADPFAEQWARAAADHHTMLLDVAYDPWPSRLAQVWPGRVIHGLDMLLHQAVRQVELFTGLAADARVVASMAAALGLPASHEADRSRA
ncbi:shikimate dehydrogenase [Falsarthrobacter nasiphocae]|uniref:Shikimate dehydrogenase n=1 Tax=Falsarthrobacter nasiphocae TaxID=189863 RepID=A0AAE3YIP2_9MICC|nr:shikimate dehydrogenase [Falsarthrobacter nasiphocae]MDR6892977.1 shikimate dehydrogenase [Falsarthrobacter nasiphocae]